MFLESFKTIGSLDYVRIKIGTKVIVPWAPRAYGITKSREF